MADYEHLPASNGSGDAALMGITAERLTGATTIAVDSVANVPAKFIGTYGTLDADGLITSASKRDFKGHVSGANLVIDGFCPGSTDDGNTIGQVVIVKPSTHWANLVAQFIKNATGFGTPENIFAAAISAVSATLSGALAVASAAITGNLTVGGNVEVTGTSRVIPASVASGNPITPTSQVYDVTALAVTTVFNVPSFTPQNGMAMLLRVKDNGTARAISFASGYSNVSGLDTPTTTVANKLLTIGAIYNSATSKWEIQGINQQA